MAVEESDSDNKKSIFAGAYIHASINQNIWTS